MTSKPTPVKGDGKRSRGRPKIGKPVPARLSDEDYEIAVLIGEGNVAEGIRRALSVADSIGLERALKIHNKRLRDGSINQDG